MFNITPPTPTTLNNGVRVLLLPNSRTSTVGVGIFIKAGSCNELPQQNGIAHFTEHMLFKGTSNRTYEEISSSIERLGGELNASTGIDQTSYYAYGLKQHLLTFIDILSDMFLNSKFEEAEIEKEKQVVLQEALSDEDSAACIAHTEASKLSYGTSPFAAKVIGTPKTITSFTREDILEFVEDHYHASNVLVVVSGNFTVVSTRKYITEKFSAVPASSKKYSPTVSPKFIGGVSLKNKNFAQASLTIRFPSHPYYSFKYYISALAAIALGQGQSSPLFKRIREQEALCYHVSSFCLGNAQIGLSGISADLHSDQVPKFLNSLYTVLEEQAENMNFADLERAQNLMLMGIASSRENPMSYMMEAAEDILIRGKLNTVDEEHLIKRITAHDISAELEYWISGPKALAIVGSKLPKEEIQLALEKYNF